MVADPSEAHWEEGLRDFLVRMELNLLAGLLAPLEAANKAAAPFARLHTDFSFS